MSNDNCKEYKKYFLLYQESIKEIKELYTEFKKTGDLELQKEFKELKKRAEENKRKYEKFAYEKIEDNKDTRETKERILLDLEHTELNENTSWETIETLSKISNIEIDLTNIKQEYKNRIINWKGSIIDKSTNVNYENLQTVGGYLSAKNAETFSADALQTVEGDLNAINAETFSADALQTVGGYLGAENAKTFSADALQTVGVYLDASSAKIFSADALQTVEGYLDARNATTFSAKQLTDVQKIYLTKLNFTDLLDKNQEINNAFYEKAEEAGRLILPEETREKIKWW